MEIKDWGLKVCRAKGEFFFSLLFPPSLKILVTQKNKNKKNANEYRRHRRRRCLLGAMVGGEGLGFFLSDSDGQTHLSSSALNFWDRTREDV